MEERQKLPYSGELREVRNLLTLVAFEELRAVRYHAIERVLLPLFCHKGS